MAYYYASASLATTATRAEALNLIANFMHQSFTTSAVTPLMTSGYYVTPSVGAGASARLEIWIPYDAKPVRIRLNFYVYGARVLDTPESKAYCGRFFDEITSRLRRAFDDYLSSFTVIEDSTEAWISPLLSI